MPRTEEQFDLEDLVITVYAALDDALAEAGVRARKGVTVTAADRSNWTVQNTAVETALLKPWRGQVERRIGLFVQQFHADRTRCRSRRHYEARRWTKVLSHNLSRHLNGTLRRPRESLAHFRLVA